MNKKGDFGNTIFLALVAVSFVMFTMTLIMSFSALVDQESKIGIRQEAVLRTNGDAALIEVYLKDSARMASKSAIDSMKENYDAIMDCGRGSFTTNLTTLGLGDVTYRTSNVTCITLNTPEDHEDICLPDVLYEYQSRLYSRMSAYIQNYDSVVEWSLPTKFEAFPMSLEKGLSVTFTELTEIPIKVGSIEIGNAYFRPAFTLPGQRLELNKIYEEEFFENLQLFIEDCAYVPEEIMDDCIRDIFGTSEEGHWGSYYGYVNDQYVFSKVLAGAQRCFALHLPGPEEI
jgi:hypothetical protein